MDYVVNLSEPYAVVLALMVTLLAIILGKEFKKSFLPAIALGLFSALILMHTFQSIFLTEETFKMMATRSMGVDAIMIFLSYISYLWVDSIETKEKNKKSIDDSLDWFWKKV